MARAVFKGFATSSTGPGLRCPGVVFFERTRTKPSSPSNADEGCAVPRGSCRRVRDQSSRGGRHLRTPPALAEESVHSRRRDQALRGGGRGRHLAAHSESASLVDSHSGANSCAARHPPPEQRPRRAAEAYSEAGSHKIALAMVANVQAEMMAVAPSCEGGTDNFLATSPRSDSADRSGSLMM